MDGFDSSVGLIILAATNRPEILDQALLRAGRFDRQVLVDRPDKKGRLDILKVHVKKVTLAQDIDLEKVAALTTGFSGADLANLVNEAALAATRRKASAVELQDFTAAIERIVAGLEKKNRVLNPKERETVAYHEMGHALAALARGKTGNYLAFFPSYAYLQQVYEAFAARWPDIPTLVQQRSLDDAGRAEFLAQFAPHPANTLLGFAVMGGIFGEGVDLVGDRLIGCAIVGVGLPQVNPRQEMLRRYYEEQSGCGFDYAYRYPGMNKVLQAAGRVVRTPQDKGVVLLLDDRFAQPDTARLFPPHWQHIQYLPGTAALETALAAFWDV